MTQEYLGLSTMSLNFDNETESLDLYMEVLRIVHRHPNASVQTIFENATLAMDATSCQTVLDSLAHQGLVKEHRDGYTITASGIKTLIPVRRDGSFPQGSLASHVAVLRKSTPPSVHVSWNNTNTVITKNGVSLHLTPSEIQQLWKKLRLDVGPAETD